MKFQTATTTANPARAKFVQTKGPKKRDLGRDERVSLAPIDFEDAMRALLNAKPKDGTS